MSIARAGCVVPGFSVGDSPAYGALPSGSSALALVGGDAGALPKVLLHTGLRAALVGVGLFAAGERAHVVRNAVAGSLAIEAFVLGWAAWKLRRGRIDSKEGTSP
jgi:hypothetical protein